MEQRTGSFSGKMAGKDIAANLFVYGALHCLVDLVCVGELYSILHLMPVGFEALAGLVLLYNFCAFALQAVFGFGVDSCRAPRLAAVAGALLTAGAALAPFPSPRVTIILLGVGNALFHVGGSICLGLTPRRAAAPGYFVAPGALGLFLGTMLGNNGHFAAWPFLPVIAVLCGALFFIRQPEVDYGRRDPAATQFNVIGLILLLAGAAIVFRSFIGFAVHFPWKAYRYFPVAMVLAIVLGKGSGGVLADRFGWMRVGVGSLLFSIVFISLGKYFPWCALAGMFLFNMTMPITLTVIAGVLPGWPAFAFGLTCLALFAGSLPVFFSTYHLSAPWLVQAALLASVLVLYAALKLYFAPAPAPDLVATET